MKRIYLTIIACWAMLTMASAQKLTVESIKVAGNDISASQYERKDLNGQACALVKVLLPLQGVVFEGNVIQPVEYKTNEYWVYMTAGSKELHIKHPNYQTLVVSFPDYDIKSMQPLTTYIFSLSTQSAESRPQQLKVSEKSVSTTDGRQMNSFSILGIPFNMVCIFGGRFLMGATSEQGKDAIVADETPTHEVTLSPYFIGETEVTQDLWEAVMGYNPSSYKAKKHPVENVSWDECQQFIRKLNALSDICFRLPTEAEWEFAARGGQETKGYKYSGSNNVDSVAWYGQFNTTPHIHKVKQKKANELGLYDMSGNVSEWCQDWYKVGYKQKWQKNPTGPSKGKLRIIRGGDCYSGYIRQRVSSREAKTPNSHSAGIGLRLACSVTGFSEITK